MIDGILDSDVVIDLLREFPAAFAWYKAIGRRQLAITPVVWMEGVKGARNGSERAQIMRFLRQFKIEYPVRDDHVWAMLQVGQFSLSHGLDITDAMIASVAVRLKVPLYTRNVKHYAMLPDVDEILPYKVV